MIQHHTVYCGVCCYFFLFSFLALLQITCMFFISIRVCYQTTFLFSACWTW